MASKKFVLDANKLLNEGFIGQVKVCSEFGQNFFYMHVKGEGKGIDVLEELLKNAEKVPIIPNEGDICIAQMLKNNVWARANVLSTNEDKYELDFIDYRVKETIYLSKIANCPDEVRHTPSFAIPCCIADIEPVNEQYSVGSEFNQLCDGLLTSKTLRTVIINGITVAEVELKRHFSDNVPYTNVTQFLIFAGYAKSKGNFSGDDLNDMAVLTSIYPPLAMSTKSKELKVLCTHAYSPSNFFLKLPGKEQDTLNKPFQQLMNNADAENRKIDKIFLPFKGQPCVVKDDIWYRGLVSHVYDSREVDVYYVDVGKTCVHLYSDLYVIHEYLAKRPPLAILCKQTGIESMNGTSWDESAIKRFIGIIEKYSSELEALFLSEKTGYWEVDLKVRINNKLVSVGQNLINNQCASYSGSSAPSSMEPLKYAFDKPRKTKREVAYDAMDRSEYICDMESNGSSTDILGNTRLEVYVVNVLSPTEIYVMMLQKKKAYDKMCKLLQESEKNELGELLVGDVCTFRRISTKFLRAKVLSIGQQIKIELIDEGETVLVRKDQLYPISERFAKLPPFSNIVMLSHIKPTCGQEQWTGSATSLLKECLGYCETVFIKKSGSIQRISGEKKALPVFMSKERVDLDHRKLDSLNQYLVENGVAFKAQAYHIEVKSEATSTEEKNETTSSDVLNPECYEKVSLNAYGAWPRSEPPDDKFDGIVSFLDGDGNVFVQPLDHIILLDDMANYYRRRYEGSTSQNEDLYWEIGSPVIARYHVDDGWYRGTILSRDVEVRVLFVDYGNVEICSHADIRVDVGIYSDTPILTYKCHLVGISMNRNRLPNAATLARLHQQAVLKKVSVTLIDTFPDTEMLDVSMVFSESLRDVAKHFKMYSCFQPDEITMAGKSEESIYSLEVPHLLKVTGSKPFPIKIVGIDSMTHIYYKLHETPDTSSYFISLRQRFAKVRHLLKKADQLCDVEPKVGKTYAAFRKSFNSWERMFIKHIGRKIIELVWIDDGCLSSISRTQPIKDLPAEAFVAPLCQCLQIEISHIEEGFKEEDKTLLEEYLMSHDVIYAQITAKSAIPKGELYYRNSRGALEHCHYRDVLVRNT